MSDKLHIMARGSEPPAAALGRSLVRELINVVDQASTYHRDFEFISRETEKFVGHWSLFSLDFVGDDELGFSLPCAHNERVESV